MVLRGEDGKGEGEEGWKRGWRCSHSLHPDGLEEGQEVRRRDEQLMYWDISQKGNLNKRMEEGGRGGETSHYEWQQQKIRCDLETMKGR